MAKNNGKENLIEQLASRESDIKNISQMGAISLLSYPEYVDSARMIMFENHSIQRVVINNTELPKVFTNFENIVGDNSSYNVTADSRMRVERIIHKFPKLTDSLNSQKAFFFVYDEENEMYDLFIRNDVENMTEKYGFQNDNSGINKYKEGDTIEPGAVLSRPTSYDEFGNYGFGRNVKAMFLCCDDTIEDNIMISESFSKFMESTEVETVVVSINMNDILLNLFGDEEHYQAFPNIGEKTNNKILCAKRRLFKRQILFDLKSSNMRRVLNSDIKTYIEGEVVDIDIYCNADISDIPRTDYNEQLLYYIQMSNDFYTQIRDYTRELLDSGIKCSQNIKSWNKRASELVDPNYKFKDEVNSEFGWIKMYFLVKRNVGVCRGQKVTGRYGNKGVCGTIVPDKLMPHLETGEVVHIVFNSLGVYNRLNIFQLYEQSINFITNRVVEKFRTGLTMKEKENILFRLLEIFNPEQRTRIEATYNDLRTKKEKEYFFEVIDKHGIQVHIQPFWHPVNLYEALQTVYKEFDWIKPYNVYFYEEVSKRWVKMMRQQIVGDLYIMKLKQSSKKQLSVCSYAPVGRTGTPEKTDSAKKHKTLIAPTPIKKGIQESINTMISIRPETYAKQHMFHRSSPIGRLDLGLAIIDNFGAGKPIDPKLTNKMTARNVQILNSYLLLMGMELMFTQDDMILPNVKGLEYDNTIKYDHKLDGETYVGTPEYMLKEYAKKRALERLDSGEMGVIYIGNEGIYKDQLIDELALVIETDIIEEGETYFTNEDLKSY